MSKYFKRLLVLIVVVIVSSCSQSSTELHTFQVETVDDTRQLFQYTNKDIPLVSAHRGGASEEFPENAISTFERTLRHTPATFEVDPRLTKDSVIVLMHDERLDRTSTGSGKLSDHTWEEVQQLKLKDMEGNPTPYHIPSLDEVIKWSKGKTVINLDKKDVPFDMVAQKIQEHEAEAHVMITVHNAEEARYYHEENENILFSAWVKTKEAFEEYDKTVPWGQVLQAYIGPEYTPDSKELVDLLHDQGVMVMIGAGPSYDQLPPDERELAYQDLVRSGIDIIETDRPVEVAQSIDTLIPPESPKHEYLTVGNSLDKE